VVIFECVKFCLETESSTVPAYGWVMWAIV